MTKLQEMAKLGQAIWLDYIRRFFITSGDLQALVDEGLRGVTSNPTIFEKAIAGSTDYDEALQSLMEEGNTAEQIYEALILEDIQRAADVLRPVYDQTRGADGYVSLEINPALAHDTQGTIAEAHRLFAALDRPNVMIKVPATSAGIPAIEALIGAGINVNVTLIFSVAQYEVVAEAYMAGLEKLAADGRDVSQVASAASFFVSQVDVAVDWALEEAEPLRRARGPRPYSVLSGDVMVDTSELQGKIAVANSKVTYARFRKLFSGPRWERLTAQGARVQRVLWASTSIKNPTYSDILYVDSLVGPDTVNTVPLATLNAFRDHGTVASTVDIGLAQARVQLDRLAELGVDLEAVTQKLQDDGVAKFTKSFESLMTAIAEKREQLLAGWQRQTTSLGPYQELVDDALAEMEEDRITARIWAHDHTVWKPEPTEISNRLGWLHIAEVMLENVPRLRQLTQAARAAGYTHALHMGMGGSSLAPEVFRKTFGVKEGYLDLAVLDSTDPGAVLSFAEQLDPARTLFTVATKSGTTAETLSFFRFFYNRVADAVGTGQAGEHFVAITDPDTHLADLARRHGFRATFLNDPNIGGRYSALSYFGLVPAALIGVDVPLLLDRAMAATCGSESCVPLGENPGARLGAALAELAKAGRDKVTFVVSPAVASFGDWVEQLIAESTGKEGKGIVPVVGEPLGPPQVYGDDRLFVHIRTAGDQTHDTAPLSIKDSEAAPFSIKDSEAAMSILEGAGHPVVRLNLSDHYDLGAQFFLWEISTAIAGHRLGINPFDQPNVEAAKVLARQMVAEYTEKGTLPAGKSAPLAKDALNQFIEQAQPGDYVALQAYVHPTPETDAALAELRLGLRDRLRLATTVGYGPRFLHSTGQLHKGDAGNGLFIQFTADAPRDAPIPDEAGAPESSITFGVLKMAQALGDYQALVDAGRRVIRFHLGDDVVKGLKRLI